MTSQSPLQWSKPPDLSIDPRTEYQALIRTDKGDVTIDLYAANVPVTVNNFVFLAEQGFYDDTIFHRVIPDFVAQGGDPTGTGRGGPGYSFNDEIDTSLKHNQAGILSMANAGPDTNGSQFFITYAPTPWLDGRHSVFGRVVDGMDVVSSFPARNPDQPEYPGVRIHSVTIVKNTPD
ncbi:MAG TPA: peptidylprolyl isomerase [Anaerolineales bacterium]|nr:peptidylprolyl isomerase [Anaerolineales bacterium]